MLTIIANILLLELILGKYEEAIHEHETELHLSEALDDSIGAAVGNRKIGECYCELGQYDKALQHQERHLSLAQSCNDDVEEQRAWATIGRTYLFQVKKCLQLKVSYRY